MQLAGESLGHDVGHHVHKANISFALCNQVITNKLVLAIYVFCEGTDLWILGENDGGMIVTMKKIWSILWPEDVFME